MIAYRVKVNGKVACLAGAEDLAVLSATVMSAGKLGSKTASRANNAVRPDVHLQVGGLTHRGGGRSDAHLDWVSMLDLAVGDTVEIQVVHAKRADHPRRRRKAAGVGDIERRKRSRS